MTFDYGLPADLFMLKRKVGLKRKAGARQRLGYRRFATAAEAWSRIFLQSARSTRGCRLGTSVSTARISIACT